MANASQGKTNRRNGSAVRSRPVVQESQTEAWTQNRWGSFAVYLVLGLCIWAVFGQTLHHDFVDYDDGLYVYENPNVTRGLTFDGVVWAFTWGNEDNWVPLTTMSQMLDCQIYGLKPGGHHLTNVILHAAAAMLLFGVLKKLTGAFWRSALVAAVFGIHPLRVESVAWVSERKDVLSGLFFMLTLWAYARYAQNQGTGGGRYGFFRAKSYWLTLGLFALGLMSKPMLVTVPLVLLLLDYWPLQRLPLAGTWFKFSQFLWEKVPFLIFSAVASLATVRSQKEALVPVVTMEMPARIGNAVVSYGVYLWQMVYPVGLAVSYPHPGNHLPLWQVLVSALVLLMVSVAVVLGRKLRPYGLVGWLWYLGMLVPVIGLVQVGSQARADRYTYLPQIGLYILVVWGATELAGRWRLGRIILGCGAVAILSGLLAAAYVQTGHWRNTFTLWTHTLACTSNNVFAHNNLGLTLVGQGKLDQAIEHCQRALQLQPDDAYAHNNLGLALAGQGRLDEAIEHYQRAIQLKPDNAYPHNNWGLALASQGRLDEAIEHYQRAIQLKPDYAFAHNNLAVVLGRQGNLTEAVQHLRKAIQLKPDYADAHSNLGNALTMQHQLVEAIEQLQRAIQLQPNCAEAQNNLGAAFEEQGKLDQAVEHYRQALRFKPDYADAQSNLGNVLAGQGKLDEAMAHLRKAIQLNPDHAEAHSNLGKALANQGKIAEALECARKALRLAEVQNNPALVETVLTQLKTLQSPAPKTPPQ